MKHLLLLALLGLCLVGCKKDQPTVHRIPPAIREFMAYDSGSYWLFENSRGGTDSLALVKRFDGFNHTQYYGIVEAILLNFKEFGHDSLDSYDWLLYSSDSVIGLSLRSAADPFSHFEYQPLLFNVPFFTGNIREYTQDTTIRKLLPQFFQSTVAYNNVYFINKMNDNSTTLDSIYINKENLFIKVAFHNKFRNVSLSLKSAKIIRP